MEEALQVHVASDRERRQAFANVHDVWGGGRSLDAHVAHRLQSAQHRRAQWFVGTLSGRVVTSLGAYPIAFNWCGEIVPGVALGAVHTRAAFRGRGFASRLLAGVEHHVQREGVKLAVLYSDIDPAFYQRLGYQLCPAWQGRCDIGNHPSSPVLETQPAFEFEPLEPHATLADLQAWFRTCHRHAPIRIDRDPAYWSWLFERFPDSRWLGIRAGERQAGFVQLNRVRKAGEKGWRLLQWALTGSSPERALRNLLEALPAAVVRFCGATRGDRVSAWLPNVDGLQACWTLEARPMEITMLKSLDPARRLDANTLAAAQWFHAADHV